MKKIYQLSDECICKYEEEQLPANFIWCVYYYWTEPYEGYGLMVVKVGENSYHMNYMGHCSCYGPMENFPHNETISRDDLIDELCGLNNVYLHQKNISSWGRNEEYSILKKVCRLEGISITQLKKKRKYIE